MEFRGFRMEACCVVSLWTPLIHGHPFFSVCRLLLRWGFKYEAAFFSLMCFSIFTAVDDVCGWGNVASKPYVHVQPEFLLQALLGTPFCSFELFRRWQLWKCPWSAELGSILFLLLGREKEIEKGYQESTETEPKNQEIEVGFVIIFIIFRVSYYCRAFHLQMWIFSLDQA
jgi:hypothetical protein